MLVYSSSEKSLTVIQIRAPVRRGAGQIFTHSLMEFIRNCNFKSIILLTGADSSRRIDSEIRSIPIRYLEIGGENPHTLTIQKLGIPSMNQLEIGRPGIPGGGTSAWICNEAISEKMGILILVWFTIEGGKKYVK